jgi:hypothetical protein
MGRHDPGCPCHLSDFGHRVCDERFGDDPPLGGVRMTARRGERSSRPPATVVAQVSEKGTLRARVCLRRRCSFCLEATAPPRIAALSIALSLMVHCGPLRAKSSRSDPGGSAGTGLGAADTGCIGNDSGLPALGEAPVGRARGDQQVARRVRADTRFLRSAQLSTAAALRLRSFQTAILDRDPRRACFPGQAQSGDALAAARRRQARQRWVSQFRANPPRPLELRRFRPSAADTVSRVPAVSASSFWCWV